VQRQREDGLSFCGWLGSQREEGDLIFAREGIWRGAQDSHVVLWIFGDHGDLQQLGRGVRPVHEDVWLAAIAKGFENVSDGEEIAFVVDEEGVAEERVMVAAGSGGLIVGVNDGAHRGDSGVVGGACLGLLCADSKRA